MIILNEAKPKYEKLDELLEEYIQDIRYSNQVNIIIDLKEIVRKFHRPDVCPEIQNQKRLLEEISSDLCNTIGHYRNYFYKKGKYTNFYVLYSYSKCDEFIKLYPEYKKDYYEKYFNEEDKKCIVIKKAVKIFEKVIESIPHAYFIETSKYDEFVYAKYLRNNTKDNELNLILSNDSIFFQLINKNTILLNIKGIRSNLITEKNCMNLISEREDVKISNKLLPLALSLSGYKKYSLEKLPKVALTTAINMLEKMVERGIVKDQDLIELPIEFDKLDLTNKMDRKILDNADLIRKNYEIIRADNVLYKNKSDIGLSFIFPPKKEHVVDDFKGLNARIFSMFPLNIDMILKGEKG